MKNEEVSKLLKSVFPFFASKCRGGGMEVGGRALYRAQVWNGGVGTEKIELKPICHKG